MVRPNPRPRPTGPEETNRAPDVAARVERGTRAAQGGMLVNTALAILKLLAGIVGHSYALIADAIESAADVFSSLVVWRGLRLSARMADERYPFGYGKAESLAAATVGLMLLGAAAGIAILSIREILTPHHLPAPYTLVVLVAVVVVKEVLFRTVLRVGLEVDSAAVRADAWHHRSDAITSAAAFVGIAVALATGVPQADDWAALVAAAVIAANGALILRPALADLMDEAPLPERLARIERVAREVPGVLATEKLRVRRAGLALLVDLHVQADPELSLHEAHVLSGKVKSAIRDHDPAVEAVLIHMEPFEASRDGEPG
jgi:cation diffusion facilitator family transporter